MSVAVQVDPESETPKLQKPWFSAAVGLLLLILLIELIVPARRQSSSFDEGFHTFAGYSYWTRGDFGLNPEHPPLVKLLAALPLLRDDITYPNLPPIFFKFACAIGARQFLYANHNADSMLFRARMAAATLTIAAALVVFAAAYEMFGATVGLLALVLFVFEPNLIAHGSFVTTDMGESLFLFAAVYAFYRYVKKPFVWRLLLAGLLVGLALAAKHSGILLVPIFFLLALVEIARNDKFSELSQGGRFKCLLRLARTFVVVGLISFGVLWSFYRFRFAAKPNGEAMVPSLSEYAADISHPWQKSLILGCAHHHLLPESYLYGATDILVFPERFMRSYVFGKQYRHAQWFYFPAVFVIKSTLGFLLLLLLLPVAIALRRTERWREILFLTIPAAVYLLAAMRSGFNIGVRHILPVYPFLVVLAAFAAWALAQHGPVWRYAVALFLVFHCVSSARAFPNPLSYSNEIWGGPSNTYKYLTDSNVDWGQQLKSTKKFLDERGIRDCWFDYLGRGIVADPGYYGISCRPLQEPIGPSVGDIPPHISGTVLISATELSGALWGPGELNPYVQFLRLRPDAIIDNGILVFHGDFDVPLASAIAHARTAQGMLMIPKPSDAQLTRVLVEAQTAVSLAPNDVGSQMALGDALMKFNRKDEAKAAYQRALSLAQTVYPEFQDNWVEELKKRLQ
jgi:4-amino-4-deoxy-L-arabinose transferase-like glycosyltransferase